MSFKCSSIVGRLFRFMSAYTFAALVGPSVRTTRPSGGKIEFSKLVINWIKPKWEKIKKAHLLNSIFIHGPVNTDFRCNGEKKRKRLNQNLTVCTKIRVIEWLLNCPNSFLNSQQCLKWNKGNKGNKVDNDCGTQRFSPGHNDENNPLNIIHFTIHHHLSFRWNPSTAKNLQIQITQHCNSSVVRCLKHNKDGNKNPVFQRFALVHYRILWISFEFNVIASRKSSVQRTYLFAQSHETYYFECCVERINIYCIKKSFFYVKRWWKKFHL